MDLWKEDINIYPIAASFYPQGGFSPWQLLETVKLGRFGCPPVNLALSGAAVEYFGIVKVSLFISEHVKPKFVRFMCILLSQDGQTQGTPFRQLIMTVR